ncbi:TPA: hypothetical protein TZW92_001850 [Streptococcus suis]|nr:hypothetical protein [Streptococcus suis]
MTNLEKTSNLLSFGLLFVGAISLLFGDAIWGIYLNTVVIALKSIFIAQQITLKNRKD